MKCPKCRNRLLQKSGTSTRLRIKGAVEIDASGICRAQCYWCSSEVAIPLELRKGEAVDEETFTIPASGS